jgi:hypothetical protein
VVAFEDYFVVGEGCGGEDAVVDYAEDEVVDAVGEDGEGEEGAGWGEAEDVYYDLEYFLAGGC